MSSQFISVRADLKQLTRALDNLAKKQIPFATANALTATARKVALEEKANLRDTFKADDGPTPFTLNSVRVLPARKNNLVASIVLQDIAANYLAPFEYGGDHYLGNKQAILDPVEQKTNQYGNIPRATIARLKARPDVFIGPVTVKGKTLNGVWQRLAPPKKGTKAGRFVGPARSNRGLKLLILFADPKPVTQRLGWHKLGALVVKNSLATDFNAALAKALASNKR